MFSVDFYKLPDGTSPVEDFLDSLNIKMRNKALDSIMILEEFGNTLREPHSKAIGDGIFELRIKFSSDITRIFYFFFIDRKIVLTNGFIKRRRKRPPEKLRSLKNTSQITRGGTVMDNDTSDFKKYLDKQLQNPEFKAEHDKTRANYEVMRALIAARTSQNITQKELARRTGIRQSNISRIENGTCSPTIATLKALAKGVGMELHIEFK